MRRIRYHFYEKDGKYYFFHSAFKREEGKLMSSYKLKIQAGTAGTKVISILRKLDLSLLVYIT